MHAKTIPAAAAALLLGGGAAAAHAQEQAPVQDPPLVAVYGHPGHPKLGALGRGTPDRVGRRLAHLARRHSGTRRAARPTFDLIATLATRNPGAGGLHRRRLSAVRIAPYLVEARKRDGALLLDLQPGRSTFMREAKAYEALVREPEVGLALDPEWNVGRRGRPGRGIGSVSAAEVNRVSRWMQGIVERHDLPRKELVVHHFRASMVRRHRRIVQRDGVRVILEMDGHGTRLTKRRTFERLARLAPGMPHSLMLFERRDRGGLLGPSQLARFEPQPSYVGYQ